MKKLLISSSIVLSLSGCASIIDGTSQEMTFNSSPNGADCVLMRDGKQIGQLTTPGTLVVKKTKHDIEVICNKEGYQENHYFVKSEIQDATWGNIILGGGIGWAIDSASGADNKYAEYVNITLSSNDDIVIQDQGSPAPLSSDAILTEETPSIEEISPTGEEVINGDMTADDENSPETTNETPDA